jgi:hypothetical protein
MVGTMCKVVKTLVEKSGSCVQYPSLPFCNLSLQLASCETSRFLAVNETVDNKTRILSMCLLFVYYNATTSPHDARFFWVLKVKPQGPVRPLPKHTNNTGKPGAVAR